MSDMLVWTRHGYMTIEPPDEPSERQPRCRCGALLSWKPTIDCVEEVKIPRCHTTYDEYGDEVIVVDGYDVEHEQYTAWNCKRCGAVLAWEDLR